MNPPDEMAQENTTSQSEESLARRSRRALLKGAVAGVAATGIAGLAAYPLMGTIEVAKASGSSCLDSFQTILTIARTLERLAVTFVDNGVKHAAQLGLSGATLVNVKAVLVEEQIHERFLQSQGAGVLASDFNFPHGPTTFTDIKTFLKRWRK